MKHLRRKIAANVAGYIAIAVALVGCPDERLSADATPRGGRPSSISMGVDVASVRAVNDGVSIDADSVSAVLRDAAPAFVACLDPDGSTGVITLRLSLDADGMVRSVAAQPTTTYGNVDARSCFERIIAVLRFPTNESQDLLELSVSLEVRTRHDNEDVGAARPSPSSETAPTP